MRHFRACSVPYFDLLIVQLEMHISGNMDPNTIPGVSQQLWKTGLMSELKFGLKPLGGCCATRGFFVRSILPAMLTSTRRWKKTNWSEQNDVNLNLEKHLGIGNPIERCLSVCHA